MLACYEWTQHHTTCSELWAELCYRMIFVWLNSFRLSHINPRNVHNSALNSTQFCFIAVICVVDLLLFHTILAAISHRIVLIWCGMNPFKCRITDEIAAINTQFCPFTTQFHTKYHSIPPQFWSIRWSSTGLRPYENHLFVLYHVLNCVVFSVNSVCNSALSDDIWMVDKLL